MDIANFFTSLYNLMVHFKVMCATVYVKLSSQCSVRLCFLVSLQPLFVTTLNRKTAWLQSTLELVTVSSCFALNNRNATQACRTPQGAL